MLKDLVFSGWAADGCEARADTLKMVSLVDFFLPFLPLERRHIETLFRMRLEETAAQLRRAAQSVTLVWAPDIVKYLTDKVSSRVRLVCNQASVDVSLTQLSKSCTC